MRAERRRSAAPRVAMAAALLVATSSDARSRPSRPGPASRPAQSRPAQSRPKQPPAARRRVGAAEIEPLASIAQDRIEVRVVKGKLRAPASGRAVKLIRGRHTIEGRTGAEGSIVLRLPAGKGDVLLTVDHDGVTYRAEPIEPAKGSGLRATFLVFGRTRDPKQLALVKGSHLLGQASEGRVTFTQVLALNNSGDRIYDPGAAGLALPLPRGVAAARISEESRGIVRFDRSRGLVLTRPVPPGTLLIRAAFELPFDSPTLELRQRLALPISGMVLAFTGPEVAAHGPSIERREEREHSGRPLVVYMLRSTARGGQLELTLLGLPYRDVRPKIVVFGLAGLIVLWTILGLAGGRRRAEERRRRREELLDRIVELTREKDRGAIDDRRFHQQRREIIGQLRQLWE